MKLYEYIFKENNNYKQQFEKFKLYSNSMIKMQMRYQDKIIVFETIDDLKEYLNCDVICAAITTDDITTFDIKMLISNCLNINNTEEDNDKIDFYISSCK